MCALDYNQPSDRAEQSLIRNDLAQVAALLNSNLASSLVPFRSLIFALLRDSFNLKESDLNTILECSGLLEMATRGYIETTVEEEMSLAFDGGDEGERSAVHKDYGRAFLLTFAKAFGRDLNKAFGLGAMGMFRMRSLGLFGNVARNEFSRIFSRHASSEDCAQLIEMCPDAIINSVLKELYPDREVEQSRSNALEIMATESGRFKFVGSERLWEYLLSQINSHIGLGANGNQNILSNPIALPIFLVALGIPILHNQLHSLGRDFSSLPEINTLKKDAFTEWQEDNPYHVYITAYAWNLYVAVSINRESSKECRALLVLHGALATLRSGIVSEMENWDRFLDDVELHGSIGLFCRLVYALCSFTEPKSARSAINAFLSGHHVGSSKVILEEAGWLLDSRPSVRFR